MLYSPSPVHSPLHSPQHSPAALHDVQHQIHSDGQTESPIKLVKQEIDSKEREKRLARRSEDYRRTYKGNDAMRLHNNARRKASRDRDKDKKAQMTEDERRIAKEKQSERNKKSYRKASERRGFRTPYRLLLDRIQANEATQEEIAKFEKMKKSNQEKRARELKRKSGKS